MDNKKIWEKNWSQLGEYSSKSAGNKWAFHLIKQICKDVSLDEGDVVIDAGCGIGSKTAVLAELFPNNLVYGFDFSSEGIKYANELYKDKKNLEFKCMDVRDAEKIGDYKIGLASAFELIEHLENWQEFLSRLCEISSKYVLLSVPSGRMREYEKQLGHYRNYRKGEIEKFMEEHGYKKVDVFYAGFPFWSPITRDVYNYVNTSKRHYESDRGMDVSFNPVVHAITFFVYRYFTFKRIGDQFMGLFIKE